MNKKDFFFCLDKEILQKQLSFLISDYDFKKEGDFIKPE